LFSLIFAQVAALISAENEQETSTGIIQRWTRKNDSTMEKKETQVGET
jgi:hypothetical protein